MSTILLGGALDTATVRGKNDGFGSHGVARVTAVISEGKN
jgi:hypothetical protein